MWKLMDALKKEFLELLDKDIEFRYAVAGYLGLSEILKRLDGLAEEQVRLREEQAKIIEELVKLGEELVKLREEQIKIREEQVKLREEQAKIGQEQVRLGEELVRLREDFNRAFDALNLRLNRVERTLEKLTVDVEDEARSIIRHRVKQELGIDLELSSLSLPGIELNIYGISDTICIVGEATVRAGVSIIDELLRKIEFLKINYPDKVKGRIIPIIYACLPLPELVDEARRRDIWLLKATQDFHKPKVLTTS